MSAIDTALLEEAREAIRVQMEAHPTLCRIGLGIGVSSGNPREPTERLRESRALLVEAEEEVATALAFLSAIRSHWTPRRRRRHWHDSYILKHFAERWGRKSLGCGYVSNGALITAALHLGLKVVPDSVQDIRFLGKQSPNAEVYLPITSRQAERLAEAAA